jgi:hypothetical protein
LALDHATLNRWVLAYVPDTGARSIILDGCTRSNQPVRGPGYSSRLLTSEAGDPVIEGKATPVQLLGL